MADLSVCLEVSIFRSDFCYLHQNRSLDRSLCYIDDIVFLDADAIALLTHGPIITPFMDIGLS